MVGDFCLTVGVSEMIGIVSMCCALCALRKPAVILCGSIQVHNPTTVCFPDVFWPGLFSDIERFSFDPVLAKDVYNGQV
jgi:hypothetical protein